MTREEATKEYREIRARAQYERVRSPEEAIKVCMEERRAPTPPPVPKEWMRANPERAYYDFPDSAWQAVFKEWSAHLAFCREREQNREFDRIVAQFLAKRGIEKPTPVQWVKAAKLTPFLCGRCAGTGQFVTYVENGVPKGPGGACFRCNGKGYQIDDDARRNIYYDTHIMCIGG